MGVIKEHRMGNKGNIQSNSQAGDGGNPFVGNDNISWKDKFWEVGNNSVTSVVVVSISDF